MQTANLEGQGLFFVMPQILDQFAMVEPLPWAGPQPASLRHAHQPDKVICPGEAAFNGLVHYLRVHPGTGFVYYISSTEDLLYHFHLLGTFK